MTLGRFKYIFSGSKITTLVNGKPLRNLSSTLHEVVVLQLKNANSVQSQLA